MKKYLGSVVPISDNFYATLNSAVFTDGSFVFVPKGVRCPMELSTYFRINEKNTGQFERTLIIAEEGAYVSYLEGCTAPQVQAAGRIPLDISAGYADYLILSSHKIGGSKGVGAIVAAAGLMMPRPLVRGGGQEKGHRAGTENLPAIAGFGAAAREALSGLERIGELRQKRDAVESIVTELVPDAVFFGADAPRLANTSFFAIPGMKAETAQIAFDLAGVALSAGSACSSGKVGPSHVLKAMGVEDGAGALRVSVGATTTDADIELFRKALAGMAARRADREQAA